MFGSAQKEARRLSDAAKPRFQVKSGTVFVLGLALCGIAGWLLYQPYLPKEWLHDFAGEIAVRAAPDPTPPEVEDVRQVQRRETPPHPYICAADFIRVPWDRLVVVTAADQILSHPLLAEARWGELTREDAARRMQSDKRYQLIVLLQGAAVVDAQLFFTFWGDLSALARPGGFSRAEAVFTAYSNDGIYFVAPAARIPAGICATP
jgi:hypothetical protein